MRVSLDIDGVIADFTWQFTGMIKDLWPGKFEQVDGKSQRTWDFVNETGIDDTPAWVKIKESWNWWMTIPPMITGDEVELINQLIESGDVYFITSRVRSLGLNVERQSEYWLDSIGINASHATVIATQAGKKGPLLDALDIEYHLDDRPETIVDLAHPEFKVISCGMLRPYNAHIQGQYTFETVYEFCEWLSDRDR